jgi:hypothetical protein
LAATYIHNLTTILADAGKSFTPGTIANGVAGGDADTHWLLLQKTDGSYWWALWRESDRGSTKLRLNFGIPAGAVATYDPTEGVSPTPRADGTTLAVTLTDHPILVRFVARKEPEP